MKVEMIKCHIAIEWKGDTRNHFNVKSAQTPDLTIEYLKDYNAFYVTDGIEAIYIPTANVPYFKVEAEKAKKKVNERG